MLFFDFLIAFVARIWYYFMRRGLRRKPTLVKLTISTLCLELLAYLTLALAALFIWIAPPKDISVGRGVYLTFFVILLLAILFVLLDLYHACSLRVSKSLMSGDRANRLFFVTNFLLLIFFMVGGLLFGYNVVASLLIVSFAINCFIHVGNMLPDEPPKKKEDKKAAVNSEVPEPETAS